MTARYVFKVHGMGGVWLGENTVPKLTETSEGVLLFSHGTDRSLWPGILIVSGIGGFHYIYLCRSRPLYLFSAIHLPSIKPSDALIDVLDTIASRLHIENRGYVGWASMLGAWYRFLSRKTNKSLLS